MGNRTLRKIAQLGLVILAALTCVGAQACGRVVTVKALGGLVAFVGLVAVLAAISARWEPEPEVRVIPGRPPDGGSL